MFNFKKLSAIGTSALMMGLTVGTAAAANYPAPFVVGGNADVAIVYGTGSGVSVLDAVEAGNIQSDLQTFMGASDADVTTSTSGGDSVLIEKSSDKFNLGNDAATVFVTAVDDDDLEELLADGTYTDDDNADYDYTQKVDLGSNLDLTHFSDTDYDDLIEASDNTPTVGIQLAGSAHVLNYTLDFTTHPLYGTLLETTTLTLMGREYYVLDVANGTTNKTTLLDSANAASIDEGETVEAGGHTVGIDFVSSTETVLDVDGELTNSLSEGETFKLEDGTYVGIKDIRYNEKEGTTSSVEFSIGTGKLEITHAADVELNDEAVEEIDGFLVQDSSEKLDKIVLMWTTDDEEFITPETELLMPGFEALKLNMGEHTVDAMEETTVEGGSTFIEITTTIKDGEVTIPILGSNATGEFATIGKDSSNKLVTFNGTSALLFNETAGDKYIVLSWNSTSEAETYYLRADVVSDNSVDKVRFTNEVTGDEKLAADDDSVSFGGASITVNSLTRVGGVNETFYFSLNSGSSIHQLYTEEGLKIYLPHLVNSSSTVEGGINLTGMLPGSSTDGHGPYNFTLFFDTENKDDNIGAGDAFNMSLDESGTTNKVHVQTVTTDGASYEVGSSDDYEYYVIDDLATKITHATGGDYDSAVVEYHGDEFYANLFLSAPDVTVSSTNTGSSAESLGEVLVKDTEISSVSSKNLIIVGGSCINSAAATALGGAYCGAAFTDATGVGSGQFLIESVGDAFDDGKVALVVAGYEVADTVNAAKYLRTQDVDTTAGKKYVGTTATSAELQVD